MAKNKKEARTRNQIQAFCNRINNGINGIWQWLKVGWIFIAFFLAVLGVSLTRIDNWLHVWVILILGVVLIIAEMLNYAIEKLCDLAIGTGYNHEVRLIKDVCAGAVLASGVILGVAGLWIIFA